MASTKVAIVSGEWQFDPDQIVRLYVRPTLTLINRSGDTQHVPAFGFSTRRTIRTQPAKTCALFPCTTQARYAFGGKDWSAGSASNQKWLESLEPITIHNLGVLTNNCSPLMAFLAVKSNVVFDVNTMCDDAICIADAYALNEYDAPLIELLAKWKQ